MITHLVFDGVAEGLLGVGLDVVGSAARLVQSGLGRAPHAEAVLRQRVVSVDGQPVRSSTGRRIAVDGTLSLRMLRAGDVLVVPGLAAAATEPAIERLLQQPAVQSAARLLSRAAEKGVQVAASCSATFIVAESGILDGQSATTTWWLLPAFARRFPKISARSDRMVIDSDGLWTAGAAFAHTDLMLAIVSRLVGPSLAQLVTRYLVLDERPSQARYMVLEHLRSSDPVLRRVEQFVGQNLDRQLSLAELAHAAAMSARTLARRIHAALGISPQKFAQRIRMSHAAHLLQTTQDSVESIAARVGYADAAAFRRVYRQHVGDAPRRGRARTARSPSGGEARSAKATGRSAAR